jgi:hypothetical protein
MDADGGNPKEIVGKLEMPLEGGRVAWRPR